MPNYQETVLKNGLRLITSTNENPALVVASLWVKAGSRYEIKEESGYSHFLEHLLCKNIRDFYNDANYNRIGAYINGRTTRDSMFLTVEASARYIEELLSMLSASARKFDGDIDKFETQKKVIIQEMQIAKDDTQKLLTWSAFKFFFGDHPIAKEPIGSSEVVENATVERIKEYQKNFFIPNNCALIISSNLTHGEILKSVTKHFDPWESGSDIKKVEGKYKVSKNHENYLYIPNTNKQTSIMISFHTPGVENMKDETALAVLANYLGGGHQGLLQEKLRHETGLVYIVNIFNTRYTDTGVFQINTSSSEPVRTISIIFDSLSSFLNSLSPVEVEETKERTINTFDRFNANSRNEVTFLGQSFILFGRLFKPEDYKKLISEVTYQNVIDVGKKYLNRENCLVAVSGSEDVKNKI